MSDQPYVLHSDEAAVSGHNDGVHQQYTGPHNTASPITHPWRKYCTTTWKFLPRIVPVAVLAAISLIVVLSIDSKLVVKPGQIYQRTSVAGYISLEQAGSVSRVNAIFEAWSPHQRLTAAFSAGLHFVLFALYSIVVTLLCLWAANHSPWKTAGDLLAWLQILSSIFAIILHSTCAYMLIHGPSNGLPQLALAMSILHLVFVNAGALYFLVVRILCWTIWKDYGSYAPLDPKMH